MPAHSLPSCTADPVHQVPVDAHLLGCLTPGTLCGPLLSQHIHGLWPWAHVSALPSFTQCLIASLLLVSSREAPILSWRRLLS